METANVTVEVSKKPGEAFGHRLLLGQLSEVGKQECKEHLNAKQLKKSRTHIAKVYRRYWHTKYLCIINPVLLLFMSVRSGGGS